MEKTYGWTGRLLRIDLPSGEISTTQSMDYADTFIGGRMLGARIYWDEVSRNAGALDPENCLMILSGPLTGTAATACSRWVMSAKSPNSYPDQYGFGNGGGFFGAALKLAGYDGLIITGRAKDTAYLLIENEKVGGGIGAHGVPLTELLIDNDFHYFSPSLELRINKHNEGHLD